MPRGRHMVYPPSFMSSCFFIIVDTIWDRGGGGPPVEGIVATRIAAYNVQQHGMRAYEAYDRHSSIQ